eukprot:scaffold7099_cov281-Pinguiococcus_pyrenoidosus.AAC.20
MSRCATFPKDAFMPRHARHHGAKKRKITTRLESSASAKASPPPPKAQMMSSCDAALIEQRTRGAGPAREWRRDAGVRGPYTSVDVGDTSQEHATRKHNAACMVGIRPAILYGP